MDVRDRMLDRAEAQLDASPQRDIAVREVCEAVGVGVPVLYRLFGDKTGLLEAVVNRGFDRYLSSKRAAPDQDDPADNLRAGWDSHIAFAMAHPAVYQLVYSPAFASVPAASAEALGLLRRDLERCARVGRLRVGPAVAAQTVMAANTGLALSMITQPVVYADPALSHLLRDAVHAALLVPLVPGAGGPSADPHAVGDDVVEAEELRRSAVQLGAGLRGLPGTVLTTEECALLQQWLVRLTESG